MDLFYHSSAAQQLNRQKSPENSRKIPGTKFRKFRQNSRQNSRRKFQDKIPGTAYLIYQQRSLDDGVKWGRSKIKLQSELPGSESDGSRYEQLIIQI